MAIHSSILAWRNPLDRGAWGATVHRVTKTWTGLKQLSTHAQVKNNVNICLTLSIKTHIGWNLSMKSDFPRTNKLCLIGLFETHYVTATQCWNTVWIS